MALPYFTQMTLGTLQLTVEASKTTSIRYLETQFGDGYRARRVDGINPLMAVSYNHLTLPTTELI